VTLEALPSESKSTDDMTIIEGERFAVADDAPNLAHEPA
jgi:hypothetical protein